jgi:hypothetical protein
MTKKGSLEQEASKDAVSQNFYDDMKRIIALAQTDAVRSKEPS